MERIKIKEFLIELIKASEKSAQIARICRAEKELFSLLVQEKCPDSKNPRFVHDFKTLADVLVQETIKHDLGLKFPGIKERIFGEENNKFTNALGESVTVTVEDTMEMTSSLLLKVLEGNSIAANLLASAVHSDDSSLIDYDEIKLDSSEHLNSIELDLNNIGVWIDPIDSTSEYINGSWEECNEFGIASTGLMCVTCLIGVYDTNDGSSLIGVANQPFYSFNASTDRWEGRYYWGFDIKGITSNNLDAHKIDSLKNIVLISGNETHDNIKKLQNDNKVLHAAGAGYKILCVAESLCDCYVSSQPTTYRWDSCAPHAILKSIGGGILSFHNAITFKDYSQINYLENQCSSGDQQKWCNLNGLIAYRNCHALNAVICSLTSSP